MEKKEVKPSRVLSKEEQQEIKDLYLAEEWGAWRIARQMHMSIHTVNRFLVKEGLMRTQEEMLRMRSKLYGVVSKMTDEEKAYIVKSYNEGVSVFSLGKEFNCTWKPIKRILVDNGVAIRDKKASKINQQAMTAKKAQEVLDEQG